MRNIEIHSKLGFYGSLVGLLAVAVAAWWMSRPANPRLTLFCEHPAEEVEALMEGFTKRTGTRVRVVYRTGPATALGMVERILEGERCDVYWEAGVLGNLRLQSEGLLEPYRSPRHAQVPAAYKDPEGHWTGMGGRLRVYAVQPGEIAADLAAIERRLEAPDLSEVTMAKPLYGATRAHYTVLWEVWGGEKLKEWHESVFSRGVTEVSGDAVAAAMVAEGVCQVGWTNSDDFGRVQKTAENVEMTPVRVFENVICLPDTISLLRSSRRPEQARRLVDFLLSEEAEVFLANKTRPQIPLGPVNPDAIPALVRSWMPLVSDGFDLNRLERSAEACLLWLRKVYGED